MKTTKRAIVTGASSGLGMLIAEQLSINGYIVHNWSKESGVDVTDALSIHAAAERIAEDVDALEIDLVVNCAGINRIDWFDKISEADFDLVMNTNAKAFWLVVKEVLPELRGGTVLNIVSNASHMPMTHSIAYNASKGAAEIMTKQMNRELSKTHDLVVFGISPNKLAGTGMSEYIDSRVPELRGWTPEQAKEYQLKSLASGEETNPATLAEFIGFLLSSRERHRFLGGCIIPYGL